MPEVGHFGASYKMVHSLSEVWSAAATPPLLLSSQLTVGEKHPLLRPAQPKAKAPPLAAHSKWHRPISKMTHYLDLLCWAPACVFSMMEVRDHVLSLSRCANTASQSCNPDALCHKPSPEILSPILNRFHIAVGA